MIEKTKNIKGFLLIVYLITFTNVVYSQSTISTDESTAPAGVIFSVKGSQQHKFIIVDSSGWLAIDKNTPAATLDVNGGIKLESPNSGNPSDLFMSFQTLSGNAKTLNPQAFSWNVPQFQNVDSLTSNVPGNLYTDDFIFGSDDLLYNGNTDHFSKMFFDVSLSAFRAGFTNSQRWDTDSLGQYSTAFGFNNKASKSAGFAIGKENILNGTRSASLGQNNEIGGTESIGIGKANKSDWPYSSLLGEGNLANRNNATLIGKNNIANGDNSTALGYGNTLNHVYNTAIGSFNVTSQPNVTAIGSNNTVTGTSSFVIGRANTCNGPTAVVVGDNNNVLAYQSVALGTHINSQASFNGSFGYKTMAVQNYAFAAGDSVKASGLYATALGKQTEATSFSSLAIGDSTLATATGTIAIGAHSKAKSAYEMVVGTHNTNYNPSSTSTWNANDRLFTIGRGPISIAPYDALIVKKNGRISVDASTFDSQLTINGFDNDGEISTLEIISENRQDTMRMDGNELDGVQFLAINANTKNPVIIGTDTIAEGYALSVGGKIAVERLRSQVKKEWPDYVFQHDYHVMTADEIEKFIRKNGHLPGIPSAEEVEDNGQNLSEMQRKMLEKIEELTLNIIKLEKKLKSLEANSKNK